MLVAIVLIASWFSWQNPKAKNNSISKSEIIYAYYNGDDFKNESRNKNWVIVEFLEDDIKSNSEIVTKSHLVILSKPDYDEYRLRPNADAIYMNIAPALILNNDSRDTIYLPTFIVGGIIKPSYLIGCLSGFNENNTEDWKKSNFEEEFSDVTIENLIEKSHAVIQKRELAEYSIGSTVIGDNREENFSKCFSLRFPTVELIDFSFITER